MIDFYQNKRKQITFLEKKFPKIYKQQIKRNDLKRIRINSDSEEIDPNEVNDSGFSINEQNL